MVNSRILINFVAFFVTARLLPLISFSYSAAVAAFFWLVRFPFFDALMSFSILPSFGVLFFLLHRIKMCFSSILMLYAMLLLQTFFIKLCFDIFKLWFLDVFFQSFFLGHLNSKKSDIRSFLLYRLLLFLSFNDFVFYKINSFRNFFVTWFSTNFSGGGTVYSNGFFCSDNFRRPINSL